MARTGGRVLDPAADGFIVELTASEAEINTFIADLSRQAELLEVARSGALGMGRARGNTQKLRVIDLKSRPAADTPWSGSVEWPVGEGKVVRPGARR